MIKKVKRLVMEGEVNPNGYMFDVETLNDAIDEYIENSGILYIDIKSLDFIQNHTKEYFNSSFEEIGYIKSYDKEFFYVKITNKKYKKIVEDMVINIHAFTKDLEEREECNLVTIDFIARIVVGKY